MFGKAEGQMQSNATRGGGIAELKTWGGLWKPDWHVKTVGAGEQGQGSRVLFSAVTCGRRVGRTLVRARHGGVTESAPSASAPAAPAGAAPCWGLA